jgi:Ca2+-binding RTX toxin-like protein
MAVLMGALEPRTSVYDDNVNQLDGAFGVHIAAVGEKTFVFVAGFQDDGISAFELGADGSLTNTYNLDGGPPTGPLEIDQAANFASATVGGTSYLYVNGADDNGISAFRIGVDGTLTNVQNIDDTDELELNDVAGKMSVATVGDSSFLIASGKDDNGISVFRVNGNGTLTNTDNIDDTDAVALDDAYDTVSLSIGGRTLVYVAAEDDNGISTFELDDEGKLTFVQNTLDEGPLELEGAAGVATAKVDGTTYLVASGSIDDGLSVFSVNGSGQLKSVYNVEDTAANGLDGAGAITTFTLDEETFVAVSGVFDSALTLFHLGAGGVLTDVTTVFDNAGVALHNSFGNAFAVVDGVPLLIGAGKADNGVTTFEIGGGDDALTGTAGTDTLLGLGGDDVLDGAGGADRMVGGSGDDTYVVDQAGDVVEEHRDAGQDTVRAATDYALGSDFENLVLLGGSALDGTGNELANTLSGNVGANTLQGLSGKDEIYGGDGRDDLLGGKGRDDLFGGRGGDSLHGGKGKDLLRGNGGADDFVFTHLGDSGTSNNTRDRIEGFGRGDQIVLRDIDAVRGSGDQAFRLDTDGSFEAGEIRLREVNAGLRVELNVDGDHKAEMTIMLANVHGGLNDSDFVF